MAFEYLHGGRFSKLSGQHVPVFNLPHSENMSPAVQTELSVFHLVPITSGSATGHH